MAATSTAAGPPGRRGQFSLVRLTEILARVCGAAGLDPTDAALLRFTNNAVFRLASQPVVVRIVASHALRYRVDKVVRVARWLAEHGVPAVRLLSDVPQPVRVGRYSATVWDAVPAGRHRPRARDLGRLLRQVHQLPLPGFALPAWRPLDEVRRRIGEASGLDGRDREFLLRRCAEVDVEVQDLRFPLPRSLVHGDAHLGNLIASPAGPVLCDFDSTCFGPPEWDLIPLAVGVIRFGEPAARYRELARTYGMDVTTWDGFDVLRDVRELKLITGVLPILSSRPELRPEIQRRLEDFRRGDRDARWSRYT